ncbi:MAG: outer membrane beta-barrel protein [Rubricoccaceae bacterium]|nr:outer membrane beta-barrel protein [Rubricoccaceae bacterium]
MTRFSLLILFLLLAAHTVSAQGRFGIGGQIGEPTGLTIKILSPGVDLDAAAEWDFGDYVFLQGHVLLGENGLPVSNVDLNFFYGPGLFLGARENADTAFGLSANFGLSYYTGPVEIFGQLTPRLRLVPDSDFDLGAAAGVRFYP